MVNDRLTVHLSHTGEGRYRQSYMTFGICLGMAPLYRVVGLRQLRGSSVDGATSKQPLLMQFFRPKMRN